MDKWTLGGFNRKCSPSVRWCFFPEGQTLFYSVVFRTTDFKAEEIAFRIDIAR